MRSGIVKFFSAVKGFGFITDIETGLDMFVHSSGLKDMIRDNDEVSFEVEQGKKGLNAVNVQRRNNNKEIIIDDFGNIPTPEVPDEDVVQTSANNLLVSNELEQTTTENKLDEENKDILELEGHTDIEKQPPPKEEIHRVTYEKIEGPKVLGKIELEEKKQKGEDGIRLSRVSAEFNLSKDHIIDYLAKNDIKISSDLNAKIPAKGYALLQEEFREDKIAKEEATLLNHWIRDEESQREKMQSILESSRYDSSAFIRYVIQLNEKKQIILQGSPGTGKTFLAEKLALYMTEGYEDNIKIVQFHPSYGYEEFIEGIRLGTNGSFMVHEGIFRSICKDAIDLPDKKFVLIIDEMNRGNIPKIFGELLYLLENRNKSVILPYSKDLFKVPPNLYIIGTMNTADRSLAFVDFAIRRRFRFIHLPPNYELLRKIMATQNIESTFTETLLENLEGFNTIIRDNSSLGKNYEVGISYFVNITKVYDLIAIWEYELLPLMEEYFYDDLSKIDDLKIVLFAKLIN